MLIIFIFYLITGLLFEYQYNYSARFIYSDVLDNYAICFIKSLTAYLLGCVGPALLMFLIGMWLLFVLIKENTKWNVPRAKSIYSGRSNKKEIYWQSGLYLLVFLVNFIAALQIRYGYLWLFILFCILEFIIAFYLIFFYVLARHISKLFEYNRELRKVEIVLSTITKKESFKLNTSQDHLTRIKSLGHTKPPEPVLAKNRKDEVLIQTLANKASTPISPPAGGHWPYNSRHKSRKTNTLTVPASPIEPDWLYHGRNKSEPNRAYTYFKNEENESNKKASLKKSHQKSISNQSIACYDDDIFETINANV